MADTKISLLDSTNKDALQVLLGLPRKWLRVYLNATQSISNGTSTDINWTAEESDPFTLFTPSATTITVPTGMTEARVVLQTVWASNATGVRYGWVEERQSDGTTFVKFLCFDESGNGLETAKTIASGWRPVTAGNKLVAMARQASGGSLNLDGGSLTRTGFPPTMLFVEFR